jgi:leucyl-tRNA synthetase
MLLSTYNYMTFNHQKIEKKWQKFWEQNNVYKTKEDYAKKKYYVLDMFPYPSGVGLHVGHPKGYIATDIVSRLKMMQGFNVLHPMGFDSFGLPTENYAIKNKINPKVATQKNIATYKNQLEKLGFSYDWDREIITSDPKYYKWTQWIFLQMYKAGLAYQSNEPINWCPDCKTGLANEDLENGLCERCGSKIEKKPIRQWVLRITDYAQRLLDDLELLKDWEPSIVDMQRHWIGRSEGSEVDFQLDKLDLSCKIFTTRLDTIFACTYLVLCPEHDLITEMKDEIENFSEVIKYQENCKNKSEIERTDLNKEKSGLLIKGVFAIHPFTKEKLPLYIADYVLKEYGTGAIMAVPAHDQRDYEFAKKYNIEIKEIMENKTKEQIYTGEGVLINSNSYNGLSSKEAREKMSKDLKATKKINYRLKDWVFSRQRYWGEPIPLIHCPKCQVVPVPEKDLPVELPLVERYEPSGTGESPLANIADWVNVKCPVCGEEAKRETNTMPQWAGSCWYYLRYIDPFNKEELVDKEKEKYFMPVDLYVGGAEHATRHLIYARFWHKFLYDIKLVSHQEPFEKLLSVGLIMGEDGRKMSKRWGNVINPDDLILEYGADALRLYSMFMGPFEQANNWNSRSLNGARKFLDKVYQLFKEEKKEENISSEIRSLLHRTILKVRQDIINFKFNTAISALMILVNKISDYLEKNKSWPITNEEKKYLLQIIAPFAPHLMEELWDSLGEKQSIFLSAWPVYDKSLLVDKEINIIIQVNGKLRSNILVKHDIDEENLITKAKEDEKIAKWIENKEILKTIYVKNNLLNIVIK